MLIVIYMVCLSVQNSALGSKNWICLIRMIKCILWNYKPQNHMLRLGVEVIQAYCHWKVSGCTFSLEVCFSTTLYSSAANSVEVDAAMSWKKYQNLQVLIMLLFKNKISLHLTVIQFGNVDCYGSNFTHNINKDFSSHFTHRSWRLCKHYNSSSNIKWLIVIWINRSVKRKTACNHA